MEIFKKKESIQKVIENIFKKLKKIQKKRKIGFTIDPLFEGNFLSILIKILREVFNI